MSLKIKRETEKRYLTTTEEDNLIFLIYRSEYKSFFQFSYKDNNQFIGNAGSICCQDIHDDSFDNGLPKDIDLYITKNGMSNPYNRELKSLINIQNLVIDIDSHNTELSPKEFQKHIIKFEKELLKRMKVKPNLINRTGRGLHLWFCIEPCHFSLYKTCLNALEVICNHIQEIMNEINETELTIDKTSSYNLNGIIRVPYSYNTKTNTWTEAELIHEDLKNVNELLRDFNQLGYFSTEVKSKKKKTKKKKIQSNRYTFRKNIKTEDYLPCLIHRKRFLEHIIKTRELKENTSRDLVMFVTYANSLILFNKDEAREYCENLNLQFEDPLTNYELESIFKQIEKKQHRFTNAKFLDFVGATTEERLYFKKSTLREEKAEQKRNNKKERNEKIVEMYKSGSSIVNISKEFDISRPTIYKIIKEIN